jgi:hypothetical protein
LAFTGVQRVVYATKSHILPNWGIYDNVVYERVRRNRAVGLKEKEWLKRGDWKWVAGS